MTSSEYAMKLLQWMYKQVFIVIREGTLCLVAATLVKYCSTLNTSWDNSLQRLSLYHNQKKKKKVEQRQKHYKARHPLYWTYLA